MTNSPCEFACHSEAFSAFQGKGLMTTYWLNGIQEAKKDKTIM
jgi:hypothetical protein